MKIGIDARFYGPESKGLGRYTQKLIEYLEKIDRSNTYVIFLRSANYDLYQPQNSNFTKVLADYRWYSFAEQIFMPRILHKEMCDLVHFPHFNVPFFFRGKFVVTIHDLILIHYPTVRATTLHPLFYWLKFAAYKIVIKRAITRAKKVIAVSKFTRDDVIATYDLDPAQVEVTYESAIELKQCPAPSTNLAKYGIMKTYILYVGNAYPHKNLKRLVRAFAEVQKSLPDLSLVLVGRDDLFYEELSDIISHEGIDGIRILHDVTDSELEGIYSGAQAYIFPSLYEGFGLPPLEAMAYGVPVAASDHPCLKEVCGKAAYYFNAQSPQMIAQASQEIVSNDALRAQLREEGFKNLNRFSWERMARQTLAIYEQN